MVKDYLRQEVRLRLSIRSIDEDVTVIMRVISNALTERPPSISCTRRQHSNIGHLQPNLSWVRYYLLTFCHSVALEEASDAPIELPLTACKAFAMVSSRRCLDVVITKDRS